MIRKKRKIHILIVSFYALLFFCQLITPIASAEIADSDIPPSTGVACSTEERICPDGTRVGRVPPNCEFAPCPTTQQDAYSDASGQTANRLPMTGMSLIIITLFALFLVLVRFVIG